MLTRFLYRHAESVLTNPLLVFNPRILQFPRAPLGYMPVKEVILADALSGGIHVINDRWTIIPFPYKYYTTLVPILAGKISGAKMSPHNIDSPEFRDAMGELYCWAQQRIPRVAHKFGAAIKLLPNLPKQIKQELSLAGYPEKELQRLMGAYIAITYEGELLSDLPEVIEWYRERFAEAYNYRLKSEGFHALYQNGTIQLHVKGVPVTAVSTLTGQLVTDPCYYMVPYLVGMSQQQLVSFDKDTFRSYAKPANLNAPMGLEESWWVAACACILFNDQMFSERLGSTSGGDVRISFLEVSDRGIVEEDSELDDIRDMLVRHRQPVRRDGKEGEQARVAAVDDASRLYRSSSSPIAVSESARLTIILREEKQGRSPLRYLSEVSVGEARRRFRNLKEALRLEGRTAPLWGIIELFKSKSSKKVKKVPSDVLISLWRCSYENTPYPDYIVQQGLDFLKVWLAFYSYTDKKVTDPYDILSNHKVRNAMALAKAHVHFSKEGGVKDTLNTGYPSTWYQLGRVVAVCQEAQRLSLEGKRTNIQETLAIFQDRPHDAFNMTMLRAEPHWQKLKENEDNFETYRRLQALRNDAISKVDISEVTNTSKLSSVQFCEFLLGYYQQLASMGEDK